MSVGYSVRRLWRQALYDSGMTMREVARQEGVSFQRISEQVWGRPRGGPRASWLERADLRDWLRWADRLRGLATREQLAIVVDLPEWRLTRARHRDDPNRMTKKDRIRTFLAEGEAWDRIALVVKSTEAAVATTYWKLLRQGALTATARRVEGV